MDEIRPAWKLEQVELQLRGGNLTVVVAGFEADSERRVDGPVKILLQTWRNSLCSSAAICDKRLSILGARTI